MTVSPTAIRTACSDARCMKYKAAANLNTTAAATATGWDAPHTDTWACTPSQKATRLSASRGARNAVIT